MNRAPVEEFLQRYGVAQARVRIVSTLDCDI